MHLKHFPIVKEFKSKKSDPKVSLYVEINPQLKFQNIFTFAYFGNAIKTFSLRYFQFILANQISNQTNDHY